MRFNISGPVYDAMLAAARKSTPCEACGLLAGRDGDVSRFFELTNADASPEHFSMIPEEQFAAIKAIRNEGLQLLGMWHSHPATPARMSAEDLRLAYAPDLVYIILSLALPGQPEIRGFIIEDGSARAVELTITQPVELEISEGSHHE